MWREPAVVVMVILIALGIVGLMSPEDTGPIVDYSEPTAPQEIQVASNNFDSHPGDSF